MPPGTRQNRRYLKIDKDKGGFKYKDEQGNDQHADTWEGEIHDFYFQDDTYQNRTKRHFVVKFREFDATSGEEAFYILSTSSSVWIEGFLMLVANLPTAGKAEDQKHITVGAFKPDDKDYLHAFMQLGGEKVEKVFTKEQRDTWYRDIFNKTEAETKAVWDLIFNTVVNWRAQHMSHLDNPRIPYFNASENGGGVKQMYGQAGQASAPAAKPTAAQPQPSQGDSLQGGSIFQNFWNDLISREPKADIDPHTWAEQWAADGPTTDKIVKAHKIYSEVCDEVMGSDTPSSAMSLVQSEATKRYKKWDKLALQVCDMLLSTGAVKDPTDGEYEDDLPF